MSRILGKSFGILKEMSHSKRIPRTIESTLQEGGEVIDKDTITESTFFTYSFSFLFHANFPIHHIFTPHFRLLKNSDTN